MATKREYLVSKGITVGRRGRFSAAAKQALSEAEKNGIKSKSVRRCRAEVCSTS